MPMPAVGEPFRDFKLGGFDSAKARADRPLVVIIWKIGCSTSRMTLPFFDRLQDAYEGAEVVGVAQESSEDLGDYALTQGIGFGQLADADLEVTRLFGVEFVPAYWLTGSDGIVIEAGGGWDRSRIESLGQELARLLGVKERKIVLPEDQVPDFQPG